MRDTSLSPIYCTSPVIHTSNAHIISVVSWHLQEFLVVQLTNALLIESQPVSEWPTVTELNGLPFWATVILTPSLLPPNFYWDYWSWQTPCRKTSTGMHLIFQQFLCQSKLK